MITQSATVTAIRLPSRRNWLPADRVTAGAPFEQGALALAYAFHGGTPVEPVTDRRPARRHGAPAGPWATTFVRAVVEVVAGDRPINQLVHWTSRSVYADIVDHQRAWADRPNDGRRLHVASVHVGHPSEATAEISARLVTGTRSTALAARLEFHGNRWTCTAIRFG